MSKSAQHQEELVKFVAEFDEANGYSPTTREIASGMGFKSVESVHRLLQALKESGRVTWIPNRARTLRIVDSGEPTMDTA